MSENIGKVIQVIGPVIDVQFEAGHLPAILNAVEVKDPGTDTGIPIDVTTEVQQHLGEGRVRCVSMQPTDGMVRGMDAKDLGQPISVPVGKETGRPHKGRQAPPPSTPRSSRSPPTRRPTR